MTIVTRHAKHRLKERGGVPKRAQQGDAERAWEEGIRHGEATGALRKYLDSVYLQKHTANNLRVFNYKVYVFVGEKLVTILELPHNLWSIVDKLKKRKQKEKEENEGREQGEGEA